MSDQAKLKDSHDRLLEMVKKLPKNKDGTVDERLLKIIKRFPRTKDGVRVVPEVDRVWEVDEGEFIGHYTHCELLVYNNSRNLYLIDIGAIKECYFSEKAAKAEVEKRKKRDQRKRKRKKLSRTRRTSR